MKKAITLKDKEGNLIYPSPYYPIGSIYMSVMEVDPSEIFGGTWEQIEDVFLLGCGSKYKNGTTGGEASHQLTINEMPSHSHAQRSRGATSNIAASGSAIGAEFLGTSNNSIGSTFNNGGNQAHNNMPPYLAVFIWKRIS